jgi:hypothetical protein
MLTGNASSVSAIYCRLDGAYERIESWELEVDSTDSCLLFCYVTRPTGGRDGRIGGAWGLVINSRAGA